jgi:hypothetical protein
MEYTVCQGIVTNILTPIEIEALSQKEFIRYLRENLWDKVAKSNFNKSFCELTPAEKSYVDMETLIKIGETFNETRKE